MTPNVRPWSRAIWMVALILTTSQVTFAQAVLDVSGQPRVRLGPFGVTPTIALEGLGIDNNVFNEADNPKQDMTGVVSPAADVSFQIGRVGARVKNTMSLIYFREFTNQRAINRSHTATIAVRVHRVTPFVTMQYVDTQERPSIEIDTRARRHSLTVGGGLSASVGSRLTLRAEGQKQSSRFADDAVFEGASLQTLLNQEAFSWTGSAGWELTPLTRITVAVQGQEDRFGLTPSRNAESLRVSPGIEFAPSALISGHASVGWRTFRLADPTVPPFTGVVASVDLAYIHRGRTQFSIHTDRDVAYSFSQSAPYYVLTGIGGAVTQRFKGSWDVTASAGRQQLAYRTATLAAPAANGTSPVASGVPEGSAYVYGAGTGFLYARASRIGFHVEYSARPAGLSGRFENLRYFSTVTYAF